MTTPPVPVTLYGEGEPKAKGYLISYTASSGPPVVNGTLVLFCPWPKSLKAHGEYSLFVPAGKGKAGSIGEQWVKPTEIEVYRGGAGTDPISLMLIEPTAIIPSTTLVWFDEPKVVWDRLGSNVDWKRAFTNKAPGKYPDKSNATEFAPMLAPLLSTEKQDSTEKVHVGHLRPPQTIPPDKIAGTVKMSPHKVTSFASFEAITVDSTARSIFCRLLRIIG